MLRPTLRQRRRGLLAAPIIMIIGLLGSVSPAAAVLIDPTFGPHSDNFGVHELIDTTEFRTVCKYGPNHHLKQIAIRPPIVFAYDRTNHVDKQKVGFRYSIEYGDVMSPALGYEDWPDWDTSPITKLDATDDRNAAFSAQSYSFTSNPTVHAIYRVSIQMLWYFPTASHKDGKAVHVVANYIQKDPTYGDLPVTGGCQSVWSELAAQAPGASGLDGSSPGATGLDGSSPGGVIIIVDPSFGPHSGNRGVHRLIDSYEFRTTCQYDGTSHMLTKIRVRPPIVFARDRTGHLDKQKVGWRYRIEWQDNVAAGEVYSDWPDLYVSPVMKADATDERNAYFHKATYTLGGTPTHDYYRVSIQMLWYFPTASHKDGSAVHVHLFYLLHDPSSSDAFASIGCRPSDVII